MLHTKIVDSKKEKILTSSAEKFIKDSKFGASIYFLGTVRNINDNKTVTGITYDSHDEMVIKSFEEIYNEADQKLDIKDKAVFIEHAKGHLNQSIGKRDGSSPPRIRAISRSLRRVRLGLDLLLSYLVVTTAVTLFFL